METGKLLGYGGSVQHADRVALIDDDLDFAVRIVREETSVMR